jgi:hypothetical protein
MKLKFAALLVPVAALGLAACADDGYASAGYHGGGYHHSRGIWYDGYYDNFYGPVYGGYWGSGDVYYYQPRRGTPYVVDSAHHFRHEQFDRSHVFHHRDRGDHPHS